MSTTTRKAFAGIAAGALALLLLVSCGAPTSVSSDLTDTAIKLSTTTVKAGKVTFHINNTSGAETHEMVVLQTPLGAGQLTGVGESAVDEEKFTSMGEKGDIAAGQSADLVLDLPAGHYALICNEPGHYKVGMYTDLTVTN